MVEEIWLIHGESCETYSNPRIHAELQERGIACNRKPVARLMRLSMFAGTDYAHLKIAVPVPAPAP